MYETVCAIHAHSTYSDGSGTVPEISEAARAAGVDVLILTDHNTLDARRFGFEGWHEDLLLIVGDEVSSRSGHCIALDIDRHVEHRQSLQGILSDIRDQEGDAYIAHPFGKYRPLHKMRNHSWRDWAATDFTGLELWSYMFDWVSGFHYSRFPSYYRHPDRKLRGPDAQTITKWDELCQQRRVVAFGGVDAHARKHFGLPFVVFPYESLFRTIRTHLVTTDALAGVSSDIATVLESLRNGKAFLANDKTADSSGTTFTTDSGLTFGDEAPFTSTLRIHAEVPTKADLTLVKDGVPVVQEQSKSLTYKADRPGVYRLEARLSGRPWLFTNPIYLRPFDPEQERK